MKIILDIKDEKAAFILELLDNFSFVKANPLSPKDAQLLTDLRDAVVEINQIKAGKKKGQPLTEFLGEVQS
jgi:hypothetical protein